MVSSAAASAVERAHLLSSASLLPRPQLRMCCPFQTGTLKDWPAVWWKEHGFQVTDQVGLLAV